MKLPDTNVLIYAANEDAPQHHRAYHCLEDAFSRPGGVGLTWISLVSFVRVTTRRGILAHPLSTQAALGLMNFWLNRPRARVLHPTDRHAELLGGLLTSAGTAGNLTNDAHLAALAIEHGATLVSFDHDFHRFDGLDFQRLKN